MKKLQLTKGFFALVDDEDFERASQFKWCASIESRGTKVYAVRWSRASDPEQQQAGRRVKIRLHRWLLGLPALPGPEDPVVDHDNDDGLDCTRANLVLRSQAENMEKVERWRRKGQKAKQLMEEDEPWL